MNSPKRLLLIDDDHALAGMLALLVSGFRREPFTLDHEDNYDSGLARLLAGNYDVCLLDYHIADRDGLELLREAKARHCITPVILLTGTGHEETDLAAMDYGAADYLEKGELTLHGLERAVGYAQQMAGMMAQLREKATHDKLTGTIIRREFDRRLSDEWRRSGRFQRPLGLVLLSLDQYESALATHGPKVADELLQHTARLLLAKTRTVDCLARFEGSVFALLMIESTGAAALATAEQLLVTVATQPCEIPAQRMLMRLTLSAGVAAWPDINTTDAALLGAAQAALASARTQGGNRVQSAPRSG